VTSRAIACLCSLTKAGVLRKRLLLTLTLSRPDPHVHLRGRRDALDPLKNLSSSRLAPNSLTWVEQIASTAGVAILLRVVWSAGW